MKKDSYKPSEDLQGVGKLTVDAIAGITDIVDEMHHKILSFGGILGNSEQKKTNGISGMVYGSIRMMSQLMGGGLDSLLDKLSLILDQKESSANRQAIISALNGVLGDYLVSKNNPLAIPMQVRYKGALLAEELLSKTFEKSEPKFLILIHGLCMNDLQWEREGHSHGFVLARELGYEPIYVRYNTGLHTSENAKYFAEILEKTFKKLPKSAKFSIIAHSMGGLVSRGACHYANLSGHSWLKSLEKIIFLGTPHHGAPLEKGGNWIDTFLTLNPYTIPFAPLTKIRSSGITDLRYGNITDNDWQNHDRFKDSKDRRIAVPLPENVECYALAATTSKVSNQVGDEILGDGLVPISSAFGQHKKTELNLQFDENNKFLIRNTNHLDLLNKQEVYQKIKEWLRQ